LLVGGKVKQLSKSDNRIGSLDPEKVYFVEKFGYLIKKINSGYGEPVQSVLFDRINNAIADFKIDLPNIVYDLEVDRLKSISNQKNKHADRQIRENSILKSGSINSKRQVSTNEIIDKKIRIAEKNVESRKLIVPERPHTLDIKHSKEYAQLLKNSNGILKPSIIEEEIEIPIEKTLKSKQSSSLKKVSSSILKPSAATIREEQRLEQLQLSQKSSEFVRPNSVSKPTIKKSKTQPKQQLTEWERKWQKFDSDIIDKEFNGYS